MKPSEQFIWWLDAVRSSHNHKLLRHSAFLAEHWTLCCVDRWNKSFRVTYNFLNYLLLSLESWSKVVYTNAYFMLWNCERLDGRGDHPCQYTITLPYSMPFSVQYLFCNQISWSMKLYGLFIFAFRNFSNGPLFMQHYFTRTLHNFLCSNMIFTKWHLLMTREALKIHVHVHI